MRTTRTVKEVADLTGVSVRTLHHYDAIGLLKPTQTTDSGYRLYDDAALQRLHTILLFRELQFSLKDIRAILDSPDFDPRDALEQQIRMLQLQRDRLDALIIHARQIKETGVIPMSFSAFDTKKIDEYAAEAKERWGGTDAYKEFRQKSQSREQQSNTANDMMAIFAEMGKIRSTAPDSQEAQEMVARLQRFITDHYYTCTREILRGLGAMYTADERFMKNIDSAGGEGTAAFASAAIAIFCSKTADQ